MVETLGVLFYTFFLMIVYAGNSSVEYLVFYLVMQTNYFIASCCVFVPVLVQFELPLDFYSAILYSGIGRNDSVFARNGIPDESLNIPLCNVLKSKYGLESFARHLSKEFC